MRTILYTLIFCACILNTAAQSLTGTIINKDQKPLADVQVALVNTTAITFTNHLGKYHLVAPDTGVYQVNFSHFEIGSYSETIRIKALGSKLNVTMVPQVTQLNGVTVNDEAGKLQDNRLNDVEGTVIYTAKKNNLVLVDATNGNKATDNARQLFAKVPGLNIWESDNGGLQLGIGVRGLSPNRTSNFNTRQNGYDIAADALGYPESYYTPPSSAIERIEVVRGAASLQYGTQFGGMLNFELKGAPEDKKMAVQIRNSAGSFGLWNSYNSMGGRIGKFSYFGYSQLKRGNGWRENSSFHRQDAHVQLGYQFNEKLSISTEYSYMHYLAQQGGGLTERLFEIDPRTALRDRNWFEIRWNVAAINLDYKISAYSAISSKTFGLSGQRKALGYLGTPNALDPLENRDLLSDHYFNLGHETRFIHRYKTGNNFSALATGIRLYQGNTQKQQGDANDGYGPDFEYLNPDRLEKSDFTFPSQNLALFAENAFSIGNRLTVTPGLRYEWISTKGHGVFREIRTNLAGDTLLDKSSESQLGRTRDFFLMGIGIGYKANQWLELYGNVSQNYRAINFNDVKVVNPNYKVDEDLQDERGANIDLGIRGRFKKAVNLDVSAFMLSYRNKIGEVLQEDPEFFRVYRLRTNISNALTYGLESFVETDILQWQEREDRDAALLVFANITLMRAYYTGSEEQAFYHKKVELVPQHLLRTGVSYQYKTLSFSWQYSYTSQQFTDATNTVSSSNAIHGIIPSFGVMDCSMKYSKSWLSLSGGINNMLNNMYFTRRAAGYPGPGLIPADGRNWFLTVGVDI